MRNKNLFFALLILFSSTLLSVKAEKGKTGSLLWKISEKDL